MVFKYNDKKYMSDDDLEINLLGFWPRVNSKDEKFRNTLNENLGYDFVGGDLLVSYLQRAVSSEVSFNDGLIDEIRKDIDSDANIADVVFKKTSSGIGRGHSLGGLSGVALGLTGTKMIDSAFLGLVASRSLVTSGRRRNVRKDELVVPRSFSKYPELIEEYLKISEEVFGVSAKIRERYSKLKAVETFNKILPYNNPANLMIVLSLDSAVTLYFEVMDDKKFGPKGKYLPKEVHALVDAMPKIMDKVGLGVMYRQRLKVPRDTYLHNTVFKDPEQPNYASELSEKTDFSIDPQVVDCYKDFTPGFMKQLENAKDINSRARKTMDKEKLLDLAMQSMLAISNFSKGYNDAVRLKISDTLSWRVWSEQKRHATLRQDVESVYSAVNRAYEIVKKLWPQIERAYVNNDLKGIGVLADEVENAFAIFADIKNTPEILLPYVYHTSRQIMFYKKLVNAGVDERDALYIVPRNVRLRTMENYDLINLINLELPLRLCSACESERYDVSWKKRAIILEEFPELEQLLGPKCWSVGMCTEQNPCKHIYSIRKYFSLEEHKLLNKKMLEDKKV